jgi:hypothetical protein
MVQRLYQEGLIYRKTARARIEDHIEHLLGVSDPNDGYRDRRRACTGLRQEPVERGRMTHGFFRPVRIRPTRPDHNRAAASGRKCGRSREACLYLPRSGKIQVGVETDAVSARSVAQGYGTGYLAVVKNTRAGSPASSLTSSGRERRMEDQDGVRVQALKYQSQEALVIGPAHPSVLATG